MSSESRDSTQMREALTAIREKLAKMRLESNAQMTRLSQTRQAADDSAAARDEQRAHRDVG